MDDKDGARVSRREVLAAGSAAAGAALVAATPLGALAQAPAETIASLPVRRLGRTGLEIGVIAGNASFARAGIVEEAVAAGVNYWQDAGIVIGALAPTLRRVGRERLVIEAALEDGGEAAVRRIAADIAYVDVLAVRGGWNDSTARAAESLRSLGIVRHISVAAGPAAVEALRSGAADIVEASGAPEAGAALGEVLAAARERDAGVILRDACAARPAGRLSTILGPYTSLGFDGMSAAAAYALAADGVSAIAIEIDSRKRLAAYAAAAARAAAWQGIALRRATA